MTIEKVRRIRKAERPDPRRTVKALNHDKGPLMIDKEVVKD